MSAVTKALAAVVEADDAAGADLIGMVVYDYLADQAEAVRDDLNRLYGAWGLDRVGVAKRHLGRTYVEKTVSGEYPDETVMKHAEWLTGLERFIIEASVSKAETFEQWARRRVNRDEKGRFARDFSGAGKRNVRETKKDRLAPAARMYIKDGDFIEDAPMEQLAVHQGQWEAAGNMLADMARNFRPTDRGKIEGIITVRNDDGRIDEIAFPLSAISNERLPDNVGEKWQTTDTALTVSIQAGRDLDDPKVEQRIAAFNALGMAGGPALQRLAEIEPQRWQSLAGTLQMPKDVNESKLTRFFQQLDAGGRVLSQITGQERLGEWAQFVGSAGPEAEKVLGPYVQRAAYRYRGTERTPNQSLVRELSSPVAGGAGISEIADTPGVLDQMNLAPSETGRVAGRMKALKNEGYQGDSLAMRTRADVSARYLATTLPKDPIYRRLSQKAGNVLPSQGVLFDADGNLVSEAVGYADDHYLPFDLKGLTKLRGGQYVRTRMTGGPTSEDIYTAVHSGARMLSVVSPSGVYTVEFDPTFRGARSGSDKAKQMYDRYVKILEAVKSSGLYLQDIDPAKRTEIEADVLRRFKDEDADGADEYRQKRLNEARAMAMLDEKETAVVEAEILQEMGMESKDQLRGSSAREFEERYSDRLDEIRSKNVNKLRLNGEGYAVALQTLQQQFPYFLKTPRYQDFKTFTQEMNLRPGQTPRAQRMTEDSGYVKPGQLRPKTGMKAKEDDPKPAAPAPDTTTTSPSTANTTTTDATTTTPAANTVQAPPVTDGIAGRLARNAAVLDRRRGDSMNSLVGAIGGIAREFKQIQTAQMTLGEALAGGQETTGTWFLTRTPDELRDMFTGSMDDADTIRVMGVLQNKGVMRQAFRGMLASANLGDEEVDEMAGEQVRTDLKIPVGEATTAEDAAEWVADKVSDIATLAFMKAPYVQPADTQGAQERHTGMKPQGFRDIINVTDRAQYAQMLGDNDDLAVRAAMLMRDGSGRDLTPAEIGEAASKRIKMLNSLELAQPGVRAGEPDALGEQGLDPAIVADEFGITQNEVENYVIDTDISNERLATQRAWTAAVTGRALQYLPGSDGGDVDPKAWSPVRGFVGKSATSLHDLMRAMHVKTLALPSQMRHLVDG